MSIDPSIDEPIQIVDYDPTWPQKYKQEARALRQVFGSFALAMEHFGSTAVPGLKSKPIIDILVRVPVLAVPREVDKALRRLGYECLGEAGVRGRLYFRKRAPSNFNLAVTDQEEIWASNLVLRDFLRSHPSEARLYERAKLESFQAGHQTLLSYSHAKEDCIRSFLQKATQWRARTKP